ncbi:MAG TPA: pyridoxal 5'-phosphate synthase glutaminase subunit PdxT [Ilumatobacteraceae bacterium]|nr:pyridoxal 5'-phosphate synthase glutaminase subunit PdxT [Ilumatobacteraceae bacterium]
MAQVGEPHRLVGVLALQGAFAAHQRALESAGATTRQVRQPGDLGGIDALVMPGGESTTMSRLLTTSGLFDDIKSLLSDGLPVLGTCAGMILLATEVLDGRPDQLSFGAIDITVQRNGYGRQIDSFETDLDVVGFDAPFHAVFVRAPKVVAIGTNVEVIAEYDGVPVVVRQGHVMVASFHPELTGDGRLHAKFLQEV